MGSYERRMDEYLERMRRNGQNVHEPTSEGEVLRQKMNSLTSDNLKFWLILGYSLALASLIMFLLVKAFKTRAVHLQLFYNFLATFIVSCVWSFLILYYDKKVEMSAYMKQHTKLPKDCDYQNWTALDNMWYWIRVEFLKHKDKCLEYYTMAVDPFWKVNPMEAISSTVALLFVGQPDFGGKLDAFYPRFTSDDAPWIYKSILLALAILSLVFYAPFLIRISSPLLTKLALWRRPVSNKPALRDDMDDFLAGGAEKFDEFEINPTAREYAPGNGKRSRVSGSNIELSPLKIEITDQSAAGKLLHQIVMGHAAYPDLAKECDGSLGKVLSHLEEMIKKEKDPNGLTKELHLWPDFHGNRSPIADPTLKGMISGLSLSNSRNDLAALYLAIIQALAYGSRHIKEEMEKAGHSLRKLVICDSLTKSRLYLQTHADVLGLPVVVPDRMGGVGSILEPNPLAKSFHDRKYTVFLRMVNDQKSYREMMQQ